MKAEWNTGRPRAPPKDSQVPGSYASQHTPGEHTHGALSSLPSCSWQCSPLSLLTEMPAPDCRGWVTAPGSPNALKSAQATTRQLLKRWLLGPRPASSLEVDRRRFPEMSSAPQPRKAGTCSGGKGKEAESGLQPPGGAQRGPPGAWTARPALLHTSSSELTGSQYSPPHPCPSCFQGRVA